MQDPKPTAEAATIILAGQRQLSWPVGSPANAGCREGRSLDRRPALAGDGGFKIPWRGRPPFGVEGGIAAHSTNRMSLDAEPSCDRPPGDALHDPFPTTRPGIRRGHGRLQHAHCAPHRYRPAFALSETAAANMANPHRPADGCLAPGSGDAEDPWHDGGDDLRGPPG